jgi:hypothetical protein
MSELSPDEPSVAPPGPVPDRREAAAHEARGAQTFATTSAPSATPIANMVEAMPPGGIPVEVVVLPVLFVRLKGYLKGHKTNVSLFIWSSAAWSTARRAARPVPVSSGGRTCSRQPAQGAHRSLASCRAGPALAQALQSLVSRSPIAEAPPRVGLGKRNGAPAVTTIPVPRIHYPTRRIHLLGARPLAELFIEPRRRRQFTRHA